MPGGAKPPVFPVAAIDDPALPEMLAESAAARADEIDADTVNRELSIARKAIGWWQRQGWTAAEHEPTPAPHSLTVSRQARQLRLPLDAYASTVAETHLAEDAQDILMRRCMKGRGLEWKTLPQVDAQDTQPPNLRRYGADEAEALGTGYHPSPDPPSVIRRSRASWASPQGPPQRVRHDDSENRLRGRSTRAGPSRPTMRSPLPPTAGHTDGDVTDLMGHQKVQTSGHQEPCQGRLHSTTPAHDRRPKKTPALCACCPARLERKVILRGVAGVIHVLKEEPNQASHKGCNRAHGVGDSTLFRLRAVGIWPRLQHEESLSGLDRTLPHRSARVSIVSSRLRSPLYRSDMNRTAQRYALVEGSRAASTRMVQRGLQALMATGYRCAPRPGEARAGRPLIAATTPRSVAATSVLPWVFAPTHTSQRQHRFSVG